MTWAYRFTDDAEVIPLSGRGVQGIWMNVSSFPGSSYVRIAGFGCGFSLHDDREDWFREEVAPVLYCLLLGLGAQSEWLLDDRVGIVIPQSRQQLDRDVPELLEPGEGEFPVFCQEADQCVPPALCGVKLLRVDASQQTQEVTHPYQHLFHTLSHINNQLVHTHFLSLDFISLVFLVKIDLLSTDLVNFLATHLIKFLISYIIFPLSTHLINSLINYLIKFIVSCPTLGTDEVC